MLLAVDAASRVAGLRVGMPLTQAQARVAGLVALDADPSADAAALERLAVWMLQRYAPIAAADPPDGIVIDSSGADHLHGGEAAMLADMLQRLASSGIAARAAIADTWGAAHALARHAADPTRIAPLGRTRLALAALPVAGLRLPADTLGGLRELGLERIADLLAQPRAPLVRRFGLELARRLDQALGLLPEPIEPVRAPDRIEARCSFAEPIATAESIAHCVERLLTELCRALAERGLGARCLDLVCERVDARAQVVRVGTSMPVRDARRLGRLLREKLESIEPGFGIEQISLVAVLAEPLVERQSVIAQVEAPEPDVSSLIDTLANRVGERGVYRIAPVASDVPERSVSRIAPLSPATGAVWPGHWPRPSRLLAPPEPIETVSLLPDHPPVCFTWRGVRRRVQRADGPERVFGEWWKRDAELAAVRDYFRVEDESGERYWIYRAGDGEDGATGSHGWYLHGIFG